MRLQDLLLSITSHHDTTLLMVTHDVNESAYLSDRVVVMASRPGRISGEIEVGLPRPRDRHNPQLTHRAADILNLLNGGQPESLVVSENPEQSVSSREPLFISRFNFAH